MNTPVNFEIAKLLKEKGFDGIMKEHYTKGRLVISDIVNKRNWNTFTDISGDNISYQSAPTIAEVVMWLYEKHGIWIVIIPYNDEELSQTLWENKIIHIADNYNDCSDYTFYHSPTEAYEAAIIYTLKNLI